MRDRNFCIALIGNPNCGKTTIFNHLTGTHQHTGNYSGVTVERKAGVCHLAPGLEADVVDLPGIYSLSEGSPEERVAFDELVTGKIDLILNVIDAGNAQRNLYLTTQLAELGIPLMLDFNMIDDAEARGLSFDFSKLASFFGSPIVTTSGVSGRGIDELRGKLGELARASQLQLPVKPKYGPKIDQAIQVLSPQIREVRPAHFGNLPERCLAIKLLENDPGVLRFPAFAPLMPEVEKWRGIIAQRNGIASDALMADYRYGVIAGACREAIRINDNERRMISNRIDGVVTNRFFGLPIFLGVMYLVFYFAFTVGEYPVQWLEQFFGWAGEFITAHWPAGSDDFLRRLIVDGVIGGVGGVLVFLPNIILLFAAIAFLEGTGYMARAAFVMDGFMHIFGLHGKSFIPMILGVGCSVPAVMATRTIESERDRLITIMVIPFMSCSARLPIYVLLTQAFFAHHQASVTMLMYLIGAVVSLGAARLLKSTVFGGEGEVFVMELPPYRLPTVQSILIQMWERAVMYLRKAGTFILGASIVMFLLNSFPVDTAAHERFSAAAAQVEEASIPAAERSAKLAELAAQCRAADLEYSVAGRIGKGLAVVLHPVGFDWRTSSALVGALAGKELFVSQLGVIFSISGAEGGVESLLRTLRETYTPMQGFAMMLFCLLSIPCIATIAVVRKETGSWKWTIFQIAAYTLTAYTITLVVYQAGKWILG